MKEECFVVKNRQHQNHEEQNSDNQEGHLVFHPLILVELIQCRLMRITQWQLMSQKGRPDTI